MSRNRNARTLRMIGLAALAGLRPIYNSADDKGGGGGGDDKPKDKPADKKPGEPTQEEKFAEMLKAERAKWEADNATKAREAQEEADRKKAEEEGKWKELADKEKAKAAELAAENRRLRVTNDLRDHLADKHPDYIGVAKYILPTIPADTKDGDLAAAIEKAAAEYVKDNPRAAKGGSGGAPAAPSSRSNKQPEKRANGNNRMAGIESSL